MNSESKKVANPALYLILLIVSLLIPIACLGIFCFTELNIQAWQIVIGCVVGIVLATLSKKAYKTLGSISNVLNGLLIAIIIVLFFIF